MGVSHKFPLRLGLLKLLITELKSQLKKGEPRIVKLTSSVMRLEEGPYAAPRVEYSACKLNSRVVTSQSFVQLTLPSSSKQTYEILLGNTTIAFGAIFRSSK